AGAAHAGAAARRCLDARESEADRERSRRRPPHAGGSGRTDPGAALMGKLRLLITGFGPFPGAPFNPTLPLGERLMPLRPPAFDDVKLASHIFHVTYATVDRELPKVLAKHRPDAMLMFGLANRTAHLRIETRARNAITTIWPDADGTRVRKGSIAADED